jgi:hypothetical protein
MVELEEFSEFYFVAFDLFDEGMAFHDLSVILFKEFLCLF